MVEIQCMGIGPQSLFHFVNIALLHGEPEENAHREICHFSKQFLLLNLFQSHNTIMHINQNYITKSVFHNNLIVRCFCHLEDYEAIKICL